MNPNQPPEPQWDPQQGRWVLPGQEPASGAAPQYGQPQYGQPQYGQPQYGYGQQGPYGAPGHVPPPPPPPKRGRRWPWIVGGLVVLLVIAGSCGSGGDTSTTAGSAPVVSSSAAAPSTSSPVESTSATATGQVVYEVTGSGTAMNVTYGDVTKGLSQLTRQRLPWTKSAPATDGFGAYGVTAQNGGSGEISCRIVLDGEEIASNTSSGQYAVVSCNGSSSPFG